MSSSLFELTLSLLLLVSACQAGLVQRHNRDIQPADVVAVPVILSEPVASELRKDQIPVQVIELQEPEPVQSQSKIEDVAVVAEPVEPVSKQIAPLAAQPSSTELEAEQVAVIAEDIAQAIEAEQKLRTVAAVIEAERINDEQIVQEEVKEAVQEENKELLRAVVEVEEAANPTEVSAAESVQQPAKQLIEEKPELVNPADSIVFPAAEQTQQLLSKEPLPSERQATQATPAQTSTPPNFMQQIIQPIGQFISQITGQQQPQQQQPTSQVTVSGGPNPAPTLPGFLNPSNAITSAQQAVQNVVNTTSQAFQGLQQIATNIGTTFQNTLSNLGGQQTQLSGSTTPRPPGPIQSFVNNIIGGNSQQSSSPPAQQQQGPLQGIISFFQGGNRPQTTVSVVTPAVAPTEQAAITLNVDDKVGADPVLAEEAEANNEVRISEEVFNEVPSNDEVANEVPSSVEVVNEVPSSVEVANEVPADSFEETQPEQLIVVNDDAERAAVVA